MQHIWTFQFLAEVRQHILGMVDNVIYHSVRNLTGFPAVKEFWKSIEIWGTYRHKRVALFWHWLIDLENKTPLSLPLTKYEKIQFYCEWDQWGQVRRRRRLHDMIRSIKSHDISRLRDNRRTYATQRRRTCITVLITVQVRKDKFSADVRPYRVQWQAVVAHKRLRTVAYCGHVECKTSLANWYGRSCTSFLTRLQRAERGIHTKFAHGKLLSRYRRTVLVVL